MTSATFAISPRPARWAAAAFLGILMLADGAASAASLSFVTNAESNTVLGIQTDPQGPATSGSLMSSVSPNTGSDIEFTGARPYATAAADASGHSGVVVDGNFPDGNAFNSLTATATFTQQFTNTTGVDQGFLYDFSILGPTLTLSDYAGFSTSTNPPLTTYYSAEITIDHGYGAVTVWNSLGTLIGGRISHELTTDGTNPFSGTLFGGGTNTFGYTFTGSNDSISDIALAGETVTITSTLIAGMSGPGYEVGGRATIGDPNNLSLASGFTGNVTVVPLPAAVWLLASGLLAMLGIARRRVR